MLVFVMVLAFVFAFYENGNRRIHRNGNEKYHEHAQSIGPNFLENFGVRNHLIVRETNFQVDGEFIGQGFSWLIQHVMFEKYLSDEKHSIINDESRKRFSILSKLINWD